jgi:hypothetical protein
VTTESTIRSSKAACNGPYLPPVSHNRWQGLRQTVGRATNEADAKEE